MADVEALLLSKVVYSGQLAAVLEARVTASFFHDVEHGAVWDWVNVHWERYGICPNLDTLRSEYPNYRLATAPEPMAFYIDGLRAHHKRFETFSLVSEVSQAVKDEHIDEALGLMADGVILIAQADLSTEDENLVETWKIRMDYYRELQEADGALKGIPTGFRTFDEITGGFQPEQFIVLIGPQKAGKSSIMLRSAVAANDSAYSAMFFGFEMTNREQGARYDGLRAGFDYNRMLQGRMTPTEWKKLERVGELKKNNPAMTFVHDVARATTLPGLAAKVAQYKPDIVFVDGVYMMDAEIDGVESMDTRALTKISRGLKRLAQTAHIPVVCSTQALDWKWSAAKGLTTAAAGYTSAFGQDCDFMFGIEPADDDNVAKMRLIAGRTAPKRLIYVAFDWESGAIEEREMPQPEGGDDLDDEESDYRPKGKAA